MKTMLRFIFAILFVASSIVANAQDAKKATETVRFTTSIDCADCVNKIMTNLPHEKGIKDVKCDLSTKEVAVTYQKDKNNSQEIRKAIEKLGFTAKETKPAEKPEAKKQ